MARLKVPDFRRLRPDLFPPVAAPEPLPAAPTLTVLLGRRQFLKALGVVAAVASLPIGAAERTWAAARGRFFTAHEFATLEALVDRIIPPDADPGARKLGAARYIQRLLTVFDHRIPRLFPKGPYSGRTPLPDNANGTPGHRRPRDGFRDFATLTRLQDLHWRAEIFGSAAVPEVAALDAQFGGPLVGLRTIYRNGLAVIDQTAQTLRGMQFIALGTADQDAVLAAVDAAAPRDPRRGLTFVDILIQHTLEGCFAPPEYGGNQHAAGWAMIGIEGDSQPLGYSIFSNATQSYVERPDHPMTTPNPDEVGPGGTVVPRPLSADGQRIQNNIATFAGLLPDTCG
jgi:hypothetical protein